MDREKENILNNLKRSGPGFTVPKTYFEKLEDRIDQSRDSIDANLQEYEENTERKLKQKSVFTLDQIGKNHGFIVPDSYFEAVEPKILRLEKPKIIPLKNNFIRILSLSIAASILLFFGIKYMNTGQNTKNQLVFQDEEFINWIESDLTDLNSYEIAEVFNDMELEQSLYAEDDVFEYLNSVDIENLILEN
jgi:hypothetical protein